MDRANVFSMLQSRHGHKTAIGYDFDASFQCLAKRGEADVAIVSTEDGFSPLGGARCFWESDLGIRHSQEITPLANWNRFKNERITLIALASRRPGSLLRGLILAPGSNTRSYEPFGNRYSRPHRDFYYNVSYEAVAYACKRWGARKLAISHLSNCNSYHEDIATCHAEALAHFCDAEPQAAPESFVFCHCCISEKHLEGIQRLNAEGELTVHRPIRIEVETRGQAVLLHLDWRQ